MANRETDEATGLEHLSIISWSSLRDEATCTIKSGVLDYVHKDVVRRGRFIDDVLEKIGDDIGSMSYKGYNFKVEGDYMDEFIEASRDKHYATEDEFRKVHSRSKFWRGVRSAVGGTALSGVVAVLFKTLVSQKNPELAPHLAKISFLVNIPLFSYACYALSPVSRQERYLYQRSQTHDCIYRGLMEAKKE